MLPVINYPGLAISTSSSERAGQAYTYKIPERTEDGWATATPKESGLNPASICKMVKFIRDEQTLNIHCVMLIKDGRLVLEEHFHGYNRNKLHFQASVEAISKPV